jgi:hypothetical protein
MPRNTAFAVAALLSLMAASSVFAQDDPPKKAKIGPTPTRPAIKNQAAAKMQTSSDSDAPPKKAVVPTQPHVATTNKAAKIQMSNYNEAKKINTGGKKSGAPVRNMTDGDTKTNSSVKTGMKMDTTGKHLLSKPGIAQPQSDVKKRGAAVKKADSTAKKP